MSDRDELAEAISDRSEYEGFPPAGEIADFLWSAGWRKNPSREEIARVLERSDPEGGSVPDEGEDEFSFWYDQADAILALLDGPTETGEK